MQMGKTSRLKQLNSHQNCSTPSKGRGTQGLQTPVIAAFSEALGHFFSLLLGWAAILADVVMACRAEIALFASFLSKLLPRVCISKTAPCAPLSVV